MQSPVLLTVEPRRGNQRTLDVEVVVPVLNEEAGLETSIHRLHAYLAARFPLTWQITIADNDSGDRTWGIACQLASELDRVSAVHLDQRGRGHALKAAWMASRAAVVAYMDVDLSTDLDALLPLVAPLLSGHSDVAIGSRLAPGARVVRGPKREVISRSYNLLLRATLGNGFTDAQCGFKAVRADVARALLPLVEDGGWFFDTELLVLAERNALRIHEVPVDWVDDPDSRVDIVHTAREDLRGVWRMLRRFLVGRGVLPTDALAVGTDLPPGLAGQLARFAGIGAISTVAFAVLFALLAAPIGPIGADITALGLCALANLAANRRITFALRDRSQRMRHYAAGLALSTLPLVMTLIGLFGLGAVGVTALAPQLAVLTLTNGLAAVLRFVALRRWVFRPGAPQGER